jgi:hypothetical protein
MKDYRASQRSVEVGYKTRWDEIADLAKKLAKTEDLSIWTGGEEFDSVEEYAAYAYYLGIMDAMRDMSVWVKLDGGKITPNVFFSMPDFCINANPECVHWEGPFGDHLKPVNVDEGEGEDTFTITLEYE